MNLFKLGRTIPNKLHKNKIKENTILILTLASPLSTKLMNIIEIKNVEKLIKQINDNDTYLAKCFPHNLVEQ